jgi:hypothetical protein
MKLTLRAALGLAAGTLIATATWATTVVDKSHATMAQESALIVTGQCSRLASAWLGRELVTVATVRVDEQIKGQSRAEIQVIIPGGIDANRPIPLAVTVPGAPQILPGEQVLLFLANEDRVSNGYAIVGFSQGKFTVIDGPNGTKAATQDLTQLNLAGAKSTPRQGKANSFPLEQIRQEIQNALAALPQ